MNRASPQRNPIDLWEEVMPSVWGGLIVALAACFSGFLAGADEPVAGEVIVTDVDGQEHSLTSVKFGIGTRRLAWLADPKGTNEEAKKGPLALEVRESMSAMPLAQGIVTLVPVRTIESIRYEFDKELVTINVKGLSHALAGPLFYPRVNSVGLSGTSSTKTSSFTGGVRGKPSVKSIAFGGAQPLARARAGVSWNIQIIKTRKDEPAVVDNPSLTARNLKVLVSQPRGAEELVDGIPIRKGSPIPFDGKLKRFELLANDLNTHYAAAEVDTGTERVVAIPLGPSEDKRSSALVGILGEVDAGWKLFPIHTIKVITPSKRKIE
jgi:hypothetical protein